jgi:DNA-binding response OmpR family regulator
MRILVADDEPDITQGLQFLFEKRGHQVVVVHDGDAALAQATRERPDTLFLDVNMPGKNGFQVCEALRALPRYRDVPVYLLTGQDQDLDVDKGRLIGVTDYLIKPFTPAQVLRLIQAAP